ncbi:MAG: hypothetical protein ACREJ3_02990, partial [Polyangiaceae bacterium]
MISNLDAYSDAPSFSDACASFACPGSGEEGTADGGAVSSVGAEANLTDGELGSEEPFEDAV